MKIISFLIITFFTVKSSFATIYYVNTQGNDANDGISIATAWRTISKVNQVRLLKGDVVRFQGGATFSGSINLNTDDRGTSTEPIVITSYGTGRALVNAGKGAGLYALNTEGIEVRAINFVGESGNTESGIFFFMDKADAMLTHITLEEIDVSGFHNYGVLFGSEGTTKGFSQVMVNKVLAHDNGDGGIGSYGSQGSVYNHKNFTIQNSKTYNNKGLLSITTTNTGNGIVLSSLEGALIDQCESYNNGENNTNPGGGPVGIWFYLTKNGIIQNSESHHNKTGTADGGGFDIDGGSQNCIIQYCYSHDNQGAGYLFAEYGSGVPFTGNKIRYNISENDGMKSGSGSLYVWGVSASENVINSEIYNNTVYIGRTGLVMLGSNFRNVKVKNNIFYSPPGTAMVSGVADSSQLHFVQNDYFSTSTSSFIWNGATLNSLAAWKAAAPTQERMGSIQYGLSVNPQFMETGQGRDGYKLAGTSPLIDVGLNLDNTGNRDFYGGVSRAGSSQDVGAYETSKTSSLTRSTFTITLLQNPVRSAITFNVVTEQPLSVSLLNSVGALLDKKEIQPNQSLFVWPVSNLPTGIYYLRAVSRNRETKTFSFLKR